MSMVPMPDSARLYRTGTRCDMLIGPCACGAMHTAEQVAREVIERQQCAPVEGKRYRWWESRRKPGKIAPRILLGLMLVGAAVARAYGHYDTAMICLLLGMVDARERGEEDHL